MKLVINKKDALGTPTFAVLSHNGEEINWNIAIIDRMSYSGDFDILEQINGYWNSLPRSNQDKIFGVYKQIKEAFGSIWETPALVVKLQQLVAELYTHHELSQILHWWSYYSNLQIPANIENDLPVTEEGMAVREYTYTKDRTYTKEDYKWLVTLSIALRIMIPIWGEYILRTRKESGSSFKEYYAYRLLTTSDIIRTEPMEKLLVYVINSIPADKSKSTAILKGGLSTEDYPTWILAQVLVRRLSIGDVRGINPSSNLASFIHSYINQRAKAHDNGSAGMVREKTIEGQGDTSESNLSKLEGYKIKEDIPAGDIVYVSYYAKHYKRVIDEIDPTINPEDLRMSLESTRVLEHEQLKDAQLFIVKWVLKSSINARGQDHLKKISLLEMLAIAQTLLWHKGHKDLAALISAIERTDIDEIQLEVDSRARITKIQLERIEELWPYTKRSIKPRAVRKANTAVEDIELIAETFIKKQWRLTLPDAWVEQITGNKNDKVYIVPQNIKILIADLAIAIAERSF